MTVSPRMNKRLEAITALVQNGYTVQKQWGAFPFLMTSTGGKKPISLFSNPAGFSWVGFFFPFAVCAQIKEWSYFYVSGIVYLITAVISAATQTDLANGASIAIAIMYGMYFPYLRYLAKENSVQENSLGFSIIIGLLLAIAVAIPTVIIDLIATVG